MRYGGKWWLAAMVVVAAAGVAIAGGVEKYTVKSPTSFTLSTSYSSIGGAVGFAGPGAIAGSTAAALSFVSGSLSHSTAGTHAVQYVHTQTGHSHYRVLATFVVGLSYSRGNSFSLLWWGNGTITSSNVIQYTSTLTEDGATEVVLSGNKTTTATANGSSTSAQQFKGLFKAYVTLVNFENEASLTTAVSSTSTISASPTSWGLANGQIAGFVFGF